MRALLRGEGWGECPHEPLGSPKFQDSSFKPGTCFKLETEIFDLPNGSTESRPTGVRKPCSEVPVAKDRPFD